MRPGLLRYACQSDLGDEGVGGLWRDGVSRRLAVDTGCPGEARPPRFTTAEGAANTGKGFYSLTIMARVSYQIFLKKRAQKMGSAGLDIAPMERPRPLIEGLGIEKSMSIT